MASARRALVDGRAPGRIFRRAIRLCQRRGRSLRQAWNAVGVSARDPVFGDLRIIPDAAEAAGEGRDPYGDDIRDHRRRRFNYPRLWLSTYGMGLTSGRVEIVGTGIAAAFLGLTFVVMGPLTLMQGCLWAALVCAPATMLGVERGNLDLIMFCLLALALLSRRRPPLAAGFILAHPGHGWDLSTGLCGLPVFHA